MHHGTHGRRTSLPGLLGRRVLLALQLYDLGYSRAQIADVLDVDEPAVVRLLAHGARQLGGSDVQSGVAAAKRRGLIF
jgi:hypothetical protein